MSKSRVTRVREAFGLGSWTSGMNCTREKDHQIWLSFWFLLIKSGFSFTKTDLVDNEVYCSEGHYSLAVRCGNLSFAYAYEHRYKRTPFIGTGLCYDGCHPGFSNHATQEKSSGRLVIGTGFTWKGFDVEVTSFNDKKRSLVACVHHRRKDGYRGKVKKRFTITAEDFRKEMSVRKKLKKRDTVLQSKGIQIFGDSDHGFYVVKKLKTKTKYYDATGEVEPAPDIKKYSLFKTYELAIEYAEKLKAK